MVQQLEPVCNKSFVCFGNWGNVASGSCGAEIQLVCVPPCPALRSIQLQSCTVWELLRKERSQAEASSIILNLVQRVHLSLH